MAFGLALQEDALPLRWPHPVSGGDFSSGESMESGNQRLESRESESPMVSLVVSLDSDV